MSFLYRLFPYLTIVLSFFLALYPPLSQGLLPFFPVTVFACWCFYRPRALSLWFIIPCVLLMGVVILLPLGFFLVPFLCTRLIIAYGTKIVSVEHVVTRWLAFVITCACVHSLFWGMLALYHAQGMVVMHVIFSFIVQSIVFPWVFSMLWHIDRFLHNMSHAHRTS